MLLFFSLSSQADPGKIKVLVWQNSSNSAPILLPQKSKQTQKDAVKTYFNSLENNSKMNEMLKRENFVDFYKKGKITYSDDHITSISKLKNENKPLFILSTNSIENLFRSPPGYFDIVSIVNKIEFSGGQAFVLPPAHDLNLSKIEREAFRDKLISLSDALFVLGGDDIDPFFYNEENTYSRGVNRRRDLSEIRFVRDYDKQKKKALFGVCRGHQLCAVIKGEKLSQDINILQGSPIAHLSEDHTIFLPENSFLREIFDRERITVNSFHHQEVIAPLVSSKVELAAVSIDKKPVTEGLQFTDRPGFTLQFHPEIMNNDIGDRIVKEMINVTNKTKLKSKSCSEVMSHLLLQ